MKNFLLFLFACVMVLSSCNRVGGGKEVAKEMLPISEPILEKTSYISEKSNKSSIYVDNLLDEIEDNSSKEAKSFISSEITKIKKDKSLSISEIFSDECITIYKVKQKNHKLPYFLVSYSESYYGEGGPAETCYGFLKLSNFFIDKSSSRIVEFYSLQKEGEYAPKIKELDRYYLSMEEDGVLTLKLSDSVKWTYSLPTKDGFAFG